MFHPYGVLAAAPVFKKMGLPGIRYNEKFGDLPIGRVEGR